MGGETESGVVREIGGRERGADDDDEDTFIFS